MNGNKELPVNFQNRGYIARDDGVAIRKMKSGALAIHPDSLLWGVAKDSDDLLSIKFSQNQISQSLSYIKKDRRTRKMDMIELHLSDRCNLRCKYCYVPEEWLGSTEVMDYENAELSIEKIRQFSKEEDCSPRIHFHGGEPGLYIKLIKKIVSKYSNELSFAIQTNGVSIKDDDLRFLIDHDVDIGVSLDSINEANDLVRSRSKLDRVLNTLRLIKEHRELSPNVLMTISKYNVDYLLDTVKKLHEIGVNSVSMNPVTAYIPSTAEYRPDENRLIENYIEAVEYALESTVSGKHPEGFFINNMESLAVSILTSRSSSYCEMTPCGAGRLMSVITMSGDLYPCSGLISNETATCGNVLSEGVSIRGLLNSPQVEMFQNREIHEIQGCNSCIYRQICGANCPIPHVNKSESINQPSTWCNFRYSLIEYIFQRAVEDPSNILDFVSYQTRASMFFGSPMQVELSKEETA